MRANSFFSDKPPLEIEENISMSVIFPDDDDLVFYVSFNRI